MAQHSWPGQSAIGKRMHVGNPKKDLPWATVVGIVADTKTGARDEPSADQWYSLTRQPAILYGTRFSGKLTEPAGGYVTVRSALPPEQITRTLRSTIAEIDPLLALQQVQPMEDVLSDVEASFQHRPHHRLRTRRFAPGRHWNLFRGELLRLATVQ
jgi:hypothetical protein